MNNISFVIQTPSEVYKEISTPKYLKINVIFFNIQTFFSILHLLLF